MSSVKGHHETHTSHEFVLLIRSLKSCFLLFLRLTIRSTLFLCCPSVNAVVFVSAARFGLYTLISRFQMRQHITIDSRVELTNIADLIFSLKCLSFMFIFFFFNVLP